MKVFLDTNIFIEYFEQRNDYQSVEKILSAIEDGKITATVSVGCVYTLAYIVRMELKQQGIHRPEQTKRLRSTLNTVLSIVKTENVSHQRLIKGINDLAFDDLEDSFQYQCAVQNKCNCLITINLRDFNLADNSKIEIITPKEFVSKYL